VGSRRVGSGKRQDIAGGLNNIAQNAQDGVDVDGFVEASCEALQLALMTVSFALAFAYRDHRDWWR